MERLEAPRSGGPGWRWKVGSKDILLETGGRKNGMRNCGRADQEGSNDWTVKE